MDVKSGIPCLDFSKTLEEGNEGWVNLCVKVREACEQYGCFHVIMANNKLPRKLCDDMSMGLKDLFDLPHETKQKNSHPDFYYGYQGKYEALPLYETFGIPNVSAPDATQAFTDLLWPNGNSHFCQTLTCMSKTMVELEHIIRKMVFESFGVGKYYDSSIEESQNIMRVMKYEAPPSKEPAIGLHTHTDIGILTVLHQDLPGLEVLSKEGSWLEVVPQEGALTIFVGEALRAWSNGRVYAAKHRVMMSGEKDRYSYGLFASPKEEAVIQAPRELVDKEHRLLFRPFTHADFIRFYFPNIHDLDGVFDKFFREALV
ncbi:hypothetical protein C5167_004739 [Papaver somniferum]|uniref:2-oxoglutarate-dependent dioxygenase DAO n=1 Tax=Papaver somniferum TaxID=3469 RepID=A0A4Y7JCR4_PAPSO|nr:hypothetical protein C5167_004739 [Papaver somniferum]